MIWIDIAKTHLEISWSFKCVWWKLIQLMCKLEKRFVGYSFLVLLGGEFDLLIGEETCFGGKGRGRTKS